MDLVQTRAVYYEYIQLLRYFNGALCTYTAGEVINYRPINNPSFTDNSMILVSKSLMYIANL